MNKTVEEVMITPVVTTTVEVTVAYVRELMERKQVSAIPIVELDGKKIHLKGIVTTSDLKGIEDESIGVDLVMSCAIESVAKESSIRAAGKKMLAKELHHLVVMEADKIVGIISSMDFVRLVVG